MSQEIEELDREIERLKAKRFELNAAENKNNSKAYIAAHKIKKADVLSADDLPMWLGHISNFAAYLRTLENPPKYAAWNDWICLTQDLLADKFKYTPACYSDLED